MTMTDTPLPSSTPATPDFAAIKTKQQAVWASGDYAVVGTTLQIVGETLAESMDLRSGQSVLDVAAGNGNATLAAARRFCRVTSTDYVGDLLARGRERAEAERFEIDYRIADVEALPFADESFDAVVSTFGAMFAPDQERTATEMLRVCRPGGKIGMANWTAEGFIGDVFRTIGRHVAPPAGVASPMGWGNETRLKALFGRDVSLRVIRRNFTFRYPSSRDWVTLWRKVYGPTHKAFAALSPESQETLTTDLIAAAEARNTAADGTMVVPSEYAEVIVTRPLRAH